MSSVRSEDGDRTIAVSWLPRLVLLGVGAALGGPLVLATISYGLTGCAILLFRRRRSQGTELLVDSRRLARDQIAFLAIFVVKVALGFLMFPGKPLTGFLFLAAYAIYFWSELRQQSDVAEEGTLEPLLTTPIRREEFLLGKALATLVPSLAIAYTVYAFVLACVELFAQPAVGSALARGPDLLAQLLFTPLLAGWSIWVGIAISTRASDTRVAQQLGTLASVPSGVVTSLIAYNVIHPTLGLALGAATALLVLNGLGWRITAAMFDPERLTTGTR